MPKLTPTSSSGSTICKPPNFDSSQPPNAASTALAIRDTSSKKPTPSTMPNDRSRARMSFHHPDSFLRAPVSQMTSSACCSSPNTLVAPTTRVTIPTTAAMPFLSL